jgi:hypothetical protein
MLMHRIVPADTKISVACNELRMLMRHRIVARKEQVRMLTFPDADASSCDGLEKTNTVACNELRMLLQHDAVKKGFRH